jgi:hypothetical protein
MFAYLYSRVRQSQSLTRMVWTTLVLVLKKIKKLEALEVQDVLIQLFIATKN